MPPYPFQHIQFTSQDGYTLSGKLYSAVDSSRFLLIGSAFGVPNGYYKHLAQYMASNGINVLAFDYRGIADSQTGSISIEQMQLKDWAEQDIEAAIAFIKEGYKPDILYYLGHSCGGQIIGLTDSGCDFDKLIIAASGVANWRLWPRAYRPGMLLVWKLLFPAAMFFRRDELFNSHLLGKVPVPRTIVKQWLDWARSKQYLFSPEHQLDLSGYQKIKQPLFSVSVTDDRYAPYAAMQALMKYYPNAQRTDLKVHPKSIGLKKIGHFGLFKKKREIEQALWQPMLNFLNHE